MEEYRKIQMKEIVMMAAWTNNTNVNVQGFTPLQSVTGKNMMFPGH